MSKTNETPVAPATPEIMREYERMAAEKIEACFREIDGLCVLAIAVHDVTPKLFEVGSHPGPVKIARTTMRAGNIIADLMLKITNYQLGDDAWMFPSSEQFREMEYVFGRSAYAVLAVMAELLPHRSSADVAAKSLAYFIHSAGSVKDIVAKHFDRTDPGVMTAALAIQGSFGLSSAAVFEMVSRLNDRQWNLTQALNDDDILTLNAEAIEHLTATFCILEEVFQHCFLRTLSAPLKAAASFMVPLWRD